MKNGGFFAIFFFSQTQYYVETTSLQHNDVVALKKAVFERFEGTKKARHLLALLGLLGQKHCLDVGEDTTLGDGDSRQQLVQFLVVPDGQLQVTGDDPGLLVVASGVACQLEHLSGQVFHHSSQVHWCASTNALGVVALAQVTVDTSYGELQTSTAGTSLGLSLGFASLSAS